MAKWVRLCGKDEIPEAEQVAEIPVENTVICLANHEGKISALANWCPHRNGPLGQGWIEEDSVLCPWHAWGFNLCTGIVDPPEKGSVRVYSLREEGEDVLIEVD